MRMIGVKGEETHNLLPQICVHTRPANCDALPSKTPNVHPHLSWGLRCTPHSETVPLHIFKNTKEHCVISLKFPYSE